MYDDYDDDYDDEDQDDEEDRERKELLVAVPYLVRLLLLILFITPVIYAGMIIGTMIHEVMGHGLAAIIIGGDITGIQIHWNGSGLASISTPSDMPGYDLAIFYLSGIFVTTLAGLILMRMGLIRRLPFFLQMGILVIASECLLGGGPAYLFWNSIFTGEHWDVGNLMNVYDSVGLRVFLGSIGLILMIIAIILVNFSLLRVFEEWLGHKNEPGMVRIIPLALLFLIQVSRWFTNDLVVNIGWWVNVVMWAITLVVLFALFHYALDVPQKELPVKKIIVPLILAFLLLPPAILTVVLL